MSSIGHLQPNQITVSSIHTNTEQTLIQITEDRLRLALIAHLGQVESKNRWHFPLGVLLALVPMLLTSEFKDLGPIDKATLKAFFLFATFSAFIWFCACLRGAFGRTTLDSLVEKVKTSQKNPPASLPPSELQRQPSVKAPLWGGH